MLGTPRYNLCSHKIFLPTVNDSKFSTIKFNEKCEYLQEEKGCSSKVKQAFFFRPYNILQKNKTICTLLQRKDNFF